jgi:hypothetical protein
VAERRHAASLALIPSKLPVRRHAFTKTIRATARPQKRRALGCRDLRLGNGRSYRGDVSVRRSALLLLVTALALPTAAQAKGNLTRLPVCGASGCKTVADVTTIEVLLSFGAEPRAAPPSSSFYTLVPHWPDQWPPTWPRYVYVPSAEAVGMAWANGRLAWFQVDSAIQGFHDVTCGLKPSRRCAPGNAPSRPVRPHPEPARTPASC